ncbi:MAG: glutathione S-transferase family protein [Pseudomonadota bacterium]
MSNTLYIGPKNYSSWSLRPWLALRWAGIEFSESLIRLDQPGYGQGEITQVKAVSPNGRVPALHVGTLIVWDTLAICEWAAEQNPSLWPKDANARAQARSVTSEMHSGFPALRRDLPMNIQRRCANEDWPNDTLRDFARLQELWTRCRETYANEGPWLFGQRSIADAFYVPVATRLRTYSVSLNAACSAYQNTLLNDEDFLIWEAQSVGEVWDKDGYPTIDGLYK